MALAAVPADGLALLEALRLAEQRLALERQDESRQDVPCRPQAGRLKRLGSEITVRHIAEALAGDTQTPGIGEAGK